MSTKKVSAFLVFFFLLFSFVLGQEGEEEEREPWGSADDEGEYWAEQVYNEGAFDNEPPNRVRLILQRTTDLDEPWERFKIEDGWLDDGTIIQESVEDRLFFRLDIMTMDRNLVEKALTATYEDGKVRMKMEVRTDAFQYLTTFARDFIHTPIKWEDDDRIEPHQVEPAHRATSRAVRKIVEKLETGHFRAGEVVAVREPITVFDQFESTDIGLVEKPGITRTEGNSAEVVGSGNDIWFGEDGFRFVHRELSGGHGNAYVQVVSQTETHGNAKAGIMIRESLDPDSRHAMISTHPDGNTHFMWRGETGGDTTATSVDGTPPIYLRVQRIENVIWGHASSDGDNWEVVGSHSFESLPDTVYVGLAVTSKNNEELNTAVFEDFRLSELWEN